MRFLNLSTSEGKVFWIIIIAIVIVFAGKAFEAPQQEECAGMSLTEAREIALISECGDRLKDIQVCNEGTGTWWIDLDIEKEGCAPACVVDLKTGMASINWRCTGLVP